MFTDMTFENSKMYNNLATKATRGIFSGFSKVIIRDSYFANKEQKTEKAIAEELLNQELTGGLLFFTIDTQVYLERV